MKLEIYGRESCPFCVKAKELAKTLKDMGYIEGYVYTDYIREAIPVAQLSEIAKTPIKTVPVVLMDGVYIGGYTDLKARFGM